MNKKIKSLLCYLTVVSVMLFSSAVTVSATNDDMSLYDNNGYNDTADNQENMPIDANNQENMPTDAGNQENMPTDAENQENMPTDAENQVSTSETVETVAKQTSTKNPNPDNPSDTTMLSVIMLLIGVAGGFAVGWVFKSVKDNKTIKAYKTNMENIKNESDAVIATINNLKKSNPNMPGNTDGKDIIIKLEEVHNRLRDDNNSIDKTLKENMTTHM